MDSLTQVVLGAAVGTAVMRRRTAAWKAALWGGICGTLPDLDAFIDHGNAVLNMTLHRAESHALFWLTLVSPVLAFAIAALNRELDRFRRWWLAVWAVLITHPLLDAMTIYGTQLALPFSDWPWGVGSIFIIDPLYTLPLLFGLGTTLAMRGPNRWRANSIGLLLSTAYLAVGVIAQAAVENQVRSALAAAGDEKAATLPILVTPTPFNTLLWRIVVMRADSYDEGFVSLLDGDRPPRFESHDRGSELYEQLRELPAVARMSRFTHGFFRMKEVDGRVAITDLRMGQEPFYSFSFVVAERNANPGLHEVVPYNIGGREGLDVAATLRWLARRALGADEAPPRPDRLNSTVIPPTSAGHRTWPSTAWASASRASTRPPGSHRLPT
ncbi:MAG: metal-dependent hydrolase [Limnobacter sp.]|nr:metal-dependent hydrolase [Limnobacter sp.]